MSTNRDRATSAALRREAHRYLDAGNFAKAAALLEQAVEINPEDVPAAVDLARARGRAGQWRDSVQPLLVATNNLPRHAPILLTLARELLARGEVLEARRCLDFLDEAPNPPGPVLRMASDVRYLIGEYESARRLLGRAMAAGLDDPEAHFRSALFHYFAGDISGAQRVLEATLERWPGHGDAIVLLASLGLELPRKHWLAHTDAMLATLAGMPASNHLEYQRAEFEYARFKLLDGLDRTDEAWAALEVSNGRMHGLYPYDPAATEDLTNAAIAAARGLSPADVAETTGPVPIFIVSMPRSGSTLLAQMLSAHSRVAGAGELPDFLRLLRRVANVAPVGRNNLVTALRAAPTINWSELGHIYLAQTQWRAGGRDFYIDKTPANILMAPLIRRALPRALILHIVREPVDTCFSNYTAMFGNRAAYSYAPDTLVHQYKEYRRLIGCWHQEFPETMYDVSYADLVRKPEQTIGEVLDYCKLGMEDACLHPDVNPRPIATPSGAQVREPIHQRALSQWRRYERHLGLLRDLLAELA